MNFKEYETDKNADGSINIRGLEIFKLCKRDGKDYDETWFQKALNLFASEKKEEYLPPAFVGHEETEGKETEAIGFLDNLKLIGKTVVADIVKVPQAVFDSFKMRKFPNRSVEILTNTGQIAGLAFLGKTRPFHKMPLMEFRDKEEETDQIIFQDDDSSVVDQIKSAILEAFGIVKNKFNEESEMTTEEKQKLVADITADVTKQFEEKQDEHFNKMFAEKFEEKTGVSPEKFDEQREEQAKKVFADSKKSAVESFKSIAPAIVNGYIEPLIDMFQDDSSKTVKFAEGEAEGNIFELFEAFAKSIVKHASDNTLVVDLEEHVRENKDDENPNFDAKSSYLAMSSDDRVALDQKVTKYMADNKIESYDDALVAYMNEKKM